MRFGDYIQRLREAKGLKLGEAARELCISPQRLSDMELGRRNLTRQPSLLLLRKIAALYDHPFASLVTNIEFFQYEKNIIVDLLEEIEPLAVQLDSKTLGMLIEARQYTPEMEGLAAEAQQLAQSLKLAILLAKSRHSKAPRAKLLDAPRTKKSGTSG